LKNFTLKVTEEMKRIEKFLKSELRKDKRKEKDFVRENRTRKEIVSIKLLKFKMESRML